MQVGESFARGCDPRAWARWGPGAAQQTRVHPTPPPHLPSCCAHVVAVWVGGRGDGRGGPPPKVLLGKQDLGLGSARGAVGEGVKRWRDGRAGAAGGPPLKRVRLRAPRHHTTHLVFGHTLHVVPPPPCELDSRLAPLNSRVHGQHLAVARRGAEGRLEASARRIARPAAPTPCACPACPTAATLCVRARARCSCPPCQTPAAW